MENVAVVRKPVEKIKINGITVRRKINPDDPVFQGVVEALEEIESPSFVREVSVIPELLRDREGSLVGGHCIPAGGFCDIRIYAGSIKRAEVMFGVDAFDQARHTMHHEIDHSQYEEEVNQGLWLLGELDVSEIEERAEKNTKEFDPWYL